MRYIGDNRESAKIMGIKIDRTMLLVFMLNGLFAAFAGLIGILINSYYWPMYEGGYLLIILAAVFVGGTSVFGGTGTIFRTRIGVLIVSSFSTGIVAIGLANFWTEMVFGVIIVIATAIYSLLCRIRKL